MELYTLQLTSQHMQKNKLTPSRPRSKKRPSLLECPCREGEIPLSASLHFLPSFSSWTLSCLERHVHAEGRVFFFFRKACWELLKMAPTATSPGPPHWAALRAVARHLFSTVTPRPTPLHISPLALCCYSVSTLRGVAGPREARSCCPQIFH